jgi:hypothetical protein|tara:strand:- start:2696 stop:3352 length:657 start_codon:yes stop_codon:yes gene_type:complete
MLKIIRFAIFTVSLALMGCVSIPREAPELSAELGKRISVIESSNITLLQRFFDQKREEVDRFIEDEWVPEFANQFFSNETISRAWDTIVREEDREQRLLFLVKIGPKLQERINNKRLELIRPLDELERRIEREIRSEYDQARAINNTITSFLMSSSKVTESRARYLEMIGVSDDKIGDLISETDSAVSNLLGKANDARDKVGRAEEFLDKVRQIKESI